MILTELSIIGLFIFCVGGFIGSWGEARKWRECGDHEYMNRNESSGELDQVKREQ